MDKILDKKVINYGEAIYEAITQEMARETKIFLFMVLGWMIRRGTMAQPKTFIKNMGN